MTARSPGLGCGSTFEIRLPLTDRSAESPSATAAVAPSPRRVLVVDDNVYAAESLALVLRLDGHETESAHSAKAALERVEPFKADVVLLDIGLPGMDGYEVARSLRRRPGLSGIRVIALTGYGQPDDLRRAKEAGVDAYLVKPVDFAALNRALAHPSSRSDVFPAAR